jgi:hypothetical protein
MRVVNKKLSGTALYISHLTNAVYGVR